MKDSATRLFEHESIINLKEGHRYNKPMEAGHILELHPQCNLGREGGCSCY
jgi:hypothetical protein